MSIPVPTPHAPRPTPHASRFLPTDAWIRRMLVPVIVFLATVSDHGYLVDFWHHLARGRAMVLQGRLVNQDLFTFTVPGETYRDVNWLSQFIYYGLFQLGGLDLVQVANALVLAITFFLAIELCTRLSKSLFWSALVGVGLFLGVWQTLTIRPQTFSMLLFVVLFDLLERSERRPVLLILPPFIIALWTNLHGAFPAGIMLVGCFFLASAWSALRRLPRPTPHAPRSTLFLGGCLVASTLAILVNPYGWNIYRFVDVTARRATERQIEEWLVPSWDQWTGVAFFVSLLFLTALIVLNWRKHLRAIGPRDWLLLACFLPLACSAVRMVVWWMLVLAPVAAKVLAGFEQKESERTLKPSIGAGLIFLLLLFMAVLGLPGLQRFHPLLVLKQQERVENDLEKVHVHLQTLMRQGRIFSKLQWGEYLSWSCSLTPPADEVGSPDFTLFMDGRIEIYPDDVWKQYWTINQGQSDWQKILDDYKVDALVLDAEFHGKYGLLAVVHKSPLWRQEFTSHNALLFVRNQKK